MRSDIKTRTMHQQDFDKMLDFVKLRQVRYNSLKTVVEFQSTSSEFQLTFTLEPKELNPRFFESMFGLMVSHQNLGIFKTLMSICKA